MWQFTAVVDRLGSLIGLATESRRRGEEKNLSRKNTGTMCDSASPRREACAPTALANPQFSQRITNTSQTNHERNWIELTASESNISLS